MVVALVACLLAGPTVRQVYEAKSYGVLRVAVRQVT